METGKLLVVVRAHSARFYIFGWLLIALIIATAILQVAVRNHRIPLFVVLALAVPLLVGLLQPNARFYDNGIALPSWPSRFLRWHEIGSYQWDGRVLTLKTKASMFSVGAIMHGRTILVPVEQQPDVKRILQTKFESE
jgi:hypothetical protein